MTYFVYDCFGKAHEVLEAKNHIEAAEIAANDNPIDTNMPQSWKVYNDNGEYFGRVEVNCPRSIGK